MICRIVDDAAASDGEEEEEEEDGSNDDDDDGDDDALQISILLLFTVLFSCLLDHIHTYAWCIHTCKYIFLAVISGLLIAKA